jgi:hypothetical protein
MSALTSSIRPTSEHRISDALLSPECSSARNDPPEPVQLWTVDANVDMISCRKVRLSRRR